jgi:hypothetical protein
MSFTIKSGNVGLNVTEVMHSIKNQYVYLRLLP